MIYYYLLSGDNEALAYSELHALLEIYDPEGRIKKCYTMICLVEHRDFRTPGLIIERSAYLKEAGTLLGIDDPYKPSYDYVELLSEKNKSWIKTSINKATTPKILARNYADQLSSLTGLKTRYMSGRRFIHLIFSEDKVFIGDPIAEINTRSFYLRRPSSRPFFRSIALPVRLSRLLVNLGRVKKGETILDPFTGTGSILIEASLMGIKTVGIEIDWKLVNGAKSNLDSLKIINYILILGDSTEIILENIDAIVTDPPYGRAASTHGADVYFIYSKFIENASTMLRRNKYLVFMAPKTMSEYIDEQLCRNGFLVRNKNYTYVHSGLTRIIYEAVKI